MEVWKLYVPTCWEVLVTLIIDTSSHNQNHWHFEKLWLLTLRKSILAIIRKLYILVFPKVSIAGNLEHYARGHILNYKLQRTDGKLCLVVRHPVLYYIVNVYIYIYIYVYRFGKLLLLPLSQNDCEKTQPFRPTLRLPRSYSNIK